MIPRKLTSKRCFRPSTFETQTHERERKDGIAPEWQQFGRHGAAIGAELNTMRSEQPSPKLLLIDRFLEVLLDMLLYLDCRQLRRINKNPAQWTSDVELIVG
ncbi:hypothetical protein AD951_03900 [Acetobacter malorum]|uniref:Uncharacterized protein n=1 Tax=Acetobacter malorum TaxID=178901 RepID=A0A149UQ96_9PROT|nr:hypothetical protein AD951_03900 [Acetobacter malorum]